MNERDERVIDVFQCSECHHNGYELWWEGDELNLKCLHCNAEYYLDFSVCRTLPSPAGLLCPDLRKAYIELGGESYPSFGEAGSEE